jgi:LmbE family N-acetylglucosaminyl deacetylase
MKILAIFAHPDDESYGPAGTLAKATKNGHIVSLLTLTRGESSSLGISKDLSEAEVAICRCEELKSAAKILGIQHVRMHSFPDKKLQNIPAEIGMKIIEKEINILKPDIIITYHDNTISGHPDHLAVTNWTFNAVKSMTPSPTLCLFGLDRVQTSMVTFQKLIPINNDEITHKIDVEDYLDSKINAIRCHKTQNEVWRQFEESEMDFKSFARWEIFVQRWPIIENKILKYNLFQ